MENKTAVEWLKNKIIEDIRLDDLISGYYSKDQYKLFLIDKLDYALELEKQQKIEFANDYVDAVMGGCNLTATEFYQETYKPTT